MPSTPPESKSYSTSSGSAGFKAGIAESTVKRSLTLLTVTSVPSLLMPIPSRVLLPSGFLFTGLALFAASFGRSVPPVQADRTPETRLSTLPGETIPLVTGKAISPLGRQTNVGSFPVNMALSPDGRYVVVTNTGAKQFLSVLSAADGSLVSQLPFNKARTDGSQKTEGLYYGLAFGKPTDQGTPLYASRGAEDRVSVLSLAADGRLADTGRSLDNPSGVPRFTEPHHIAGLALDGAGSRLYAVNNNTLPAKENRGSLSILDVAANRVSAKIPLAGFPYAVAALTAGRHADRKVYVSSERDGVVSIVDPTLGKVVKDLPTGDHPLALLFNRKQDRLYVANAGSDTVSVVSTGSDRVERTILLRPDDARGLPGATPTSLALSPDEKRLFVTLADMNAVAVVDLPSGKLRGYLPAGWYPTAVLVSPDGKRLFVANAKGVNARNPNAPPGGRPASFAPGRSPQYIQNVIEGTVSTIELSVLKELPRFTERTVENNRIWPRMDRAEVPGFTNPGIEHVIYILKENRTYDQVLGDLPQGNGDPKLCFFPREVTPNQHALAERFVLLDNFYCCAEVSADGWNWSTSGMANEYTARNAPYGYSGRGRNYDYEGANNGVPVDLQNIPDVARAPGGYIWDRVAEKGHSLRNYGFFVSVDLSDDGLPSNAVRSQANQATKKLLAAHTDESFRQFDMAYADSDAWVLHNAPAPVQTRTYGKFKSRSRFEEWKREFDEYVRQGTLPRFMMLRMPRDHTQGTSPGYHSPRAQVADNDFAVGQIVEAISKSPFWKKTAIFIIEDDAQNGFDHVDAHRSVCFVVSPFVKQATVDHRFYNTDSVLRTMELLLGARPMNQYDAVAPPLRVFGDQPANDASYRAILPPRAIIAEVNKATAYRAQDSLKLDFTKEDSVPDEVLNDILWHGLRGRHTPKPPIRYGLRIMPEEEEEEEEAEDDD